PQPSRSDEPRSPRRRGQGLPPGRAGRRVEDDDPRGGARPRAPRRVPVVHRPHRLRAAGWRGGSSRHLGRRNHRPLPPRRRREVAGHTEEPMRATATAPDPSPAAPPLKPGFEEEALPHMDAVYHYALRLARGRRAEADDLLQETYLRAYRSW